VRAQIIRARKLEAHSFFFLNFKGTPSQEEHKAIFCSLSEINWFCLDKVMAFFLTVRSTLCDTSVDFLQSVNLKKGQFSKTLQRKAILQGKGCSRLYYFGINEIPVSQLDPESQLDQTKPSH
jgi:hypothetical protein